MISTSTPRSGLVQAIAEVAALCPEMRMGQLVVNLATLARGPHKESIWDVEDDKLLAVARQQRDVLLQRHS